jgi:hypothetical protein
MEGCPLGRGLIVDKDAEQPESPSPVTGYTQLEFSLYWGYACW